MDVEYGPSLNIRLYVVERPCIFLLLFFFVITPILFPFPGCHIYFSVISKDYPLFFLFIIGPNYSTYPPLPPPLLCLPPISPLFRTFQGSVQNMCMTSFLIECSHEFFFTDYGVLYSFVFCTQKTIEIDNIPIVL